jgi:hypothetical protein
MKKMIQLSFSTVLLLLILICSSCLQEEEIVQPQGTSPRTSIGTGGFSLWTTCGSNAYVSGSNIVVPIGTGCGTKYNAAQARNSIYGSNWACNAAINGGSGAWSGASEQAIFTCDNVSSWDGNEMGFVRTLSDNVLKAYLQGGGQYIYTVVGGSGWHAYKCSASGLRKVDFYIDNVYRTSLTNNSGVYQNRNYYFVATNHYHGGGNPANWNITFNSANVW